VTVLLSVIYSDIDMETYSSFLGSQLHADYSILPVLVYRELHEIGRML
jgi:hypothetical protein